jgi:hypothetical protein
MKTKENNRMIAEFMGAKITDINGIQKPIYYPIMGKSVNKLKYHESWDWLMPVVDKIESLEGTNGNNYKFTIQNETSYIDCTNIISSPSAKYKIESAYEVVISFIEFYNKP